MGFQNQMKSTDVYVFNKLRLKSLDKKSVQESPTKIKMFRDLSRSCWWALFWVPRVYDFTNLHHNPMSAKLFQSCLILCDLMDCSPPGSSVHGILQSRILEWCPPPGDLPNPGMESSLLCLLPWQVGSLPRAPSEKMNKPMSYTLLPSTIYEGGNPGTESGRKLARINSASKWWS